LVQVNLEAGEIGRCAVPDAGVVGDPATVADLIVRWLDEAEISPSGFRTAALQATIDAQAGQFSPVADNGDGTVDFRHALEQLDHLLPQDRFLVVGAGRFMRKAWTTVRATDPQSFINTSNFSSIGLGVGYAIGAAAGAPNRPIVLIEGDGGFMHAGLTEFNTAVRENLDLIVAVCNDGAYGAEHIKFRERDLDADNIVFDWPELAPLAVALGGEGVTVRESADWAKVETALRERTRPLLIDIKLDPNRVTF
jgi:thiamine pyrophosphate-dependent acetolactate synthase large subunit-like protein